MIIPITNQLKILLLKYYCFIEMAHEFKVLYFLDNLKIINQKTVINVNYSNYQLK